MTSRPVPAGSVISRPSAAGAAATRAPEGGARDQGTGLPGFGAFDLNREQRPGQQFRDRSLPDDAVAVDDGDPVTGPLDLVQKVGGQHDRAALGHQRPDHVADPGYPGGVEPVHRLVQNEQLRVSEQARPCTSSCPRRQ